MPRMHCQRFSGRGRLLAGGCLLLLLGLAARLIGVERSIHGAMDERAARQQGRRETLPARPGDVLDVRGRLLATSVETKSLFVDPKAIEQKDEVAGSLALALDLDAAVIRQRIEQNAERRFLWIKRRLSDDEVRAVCDLHWPRHWVGFRTELERSYPQGAFASHVVGIRDIDGVGRDGVERALDPLLAGKPGYRILAHDASGRTLVIHEQLTRPPQTGSTVVLTIDSVIQTYVEEAIDGLMESWKPASASVIVMNPRTGDVLALANRPAFNPSDPASATPESWVNRAISDSYEPGSTFKPFIMAAALDWGIVRRDEKINCHNGLYRMGPRLLRSHHPHGELTVPEIMMRSDNIGMAIIGERLGNPGLFRAVQSFGFGRPTGIELPGESPGLVRPLCDWTPYYSTGSIPMGQELATTPIQLITAFSALANGGQYLKPRIVRAVVGADGAAHELPAEPSVLSRPIRAETAGYMIDPILRGVVEEAHGTGRRADLVGYSVFGKTGTAQRQGNEGGYAAGRHVSSFIAGAPASSPEVVALVVVNDPSVGKTHYGGEVAAPATRDILRRTLVYLRVQPDREVVSKPARRRGM